MNISLMTLELIVVGLGLGLLLSDFWIRPEHRRTLGRGLALVLTLVLAGSFTLDVALPRYAFGGMFVLDALSLFFKQLSLAGAILVLLLAVETADRLGSALAEFYSLVLMALAGMMFCASVNDFSLLFVSLELITVTFYVLVSFDRRRQRCLEAGVKYLILGALASAFLVFGIALVFGMTGHLNFDEVAANSWKIKFNPVLLFGALLVVAGLAFKIAAFPFHVWAPDVYQGAPIPVTAFLAVGSKAAGAVLLLRVLFVALPEIAQEWPVLLMGLSAVTILYGNLCAIPQRNIKRLMGYSSMAGGGYLLLGLAALNSAGHAAVLYYLAGYLFTAAAAFVVIALVYRNLEHEDIGELAGLFQRSSLLGTALTLALISLAGVPPLAGFFGKFLLLKAVVQEAGNQPLYLALAGVAIAGVVISFYYYFGILRVLFWGEARPNLEPLAVSRPMQAVLAVCIFGMLYLGMFPNSVLELANHAVGPLRF